MDQVLSGNLNSVMTAVVCFDGGDQVLPSHLLRLGEPPKLWIPLIHFGSEAAPRNLIGSCEFSTAQMNVLTRLPPFDSESGNLNVVIDTPKGCRSKFGYDMRRKAYVLKSVLPQGTVFPFDFGSIPGTKAED